MTIASMSTTVSYVTTGLREPRVGRSDVSIYAATKYTGFLIPAAGGLFNKPLIPMMFDLVIKRVQTTGVTTDQVGSMSTTIAAYTKYTGLDAVMNGVVSSYKPSMFWLDFTKPRIQTTGITTDLIGSTKTRFSEQLQMTGMRLPKVASLSARVVGWQAATVSQVITAAQSLIQFWS